MRKITFNDNDTELIQQIIAYQKEHEIKTFVEAVRQLCRTGLHQSVHLNINFK